jgi:hypothetical protein
MYLELREDFSEPMTVFHKRLSQLWQPFVHINIADIYFSWQKELYSASFQRSLIKRSDGRNVSGAYLGEGERERYPSDVIGQGDKRHCQLHAVIG